MKKTLINVKRINNTDVITTSCSVDLSYYNVFIKSNGTYVYNEYMVAKDGFYYAYDTKTDSFGIVPYGDLDYYSEPRPTLKDGQWYHVHYVDEFPVYETSLVECKDPSKHNSKLPK